MSKEQVEKNHPLEETKVHLSPPHTDPVKATAMITQPPESLGKRYTRIFCVVCLYWFVSITMVFVNKSLLSGKADFNAPFFVTWFQCVVTVAGCYVVSALSRAYPNRIDFPRPSLDRSMLYQVLPLSIVFVSMIAFNNLCLQERRGFGVKRNRNTVTETVVVYGN